MLPPMTLPQGVTPPGSTTPSTPNLPPPMQRPPPPRLLYPQRPPPSLAAIQREQQEQMLRQQAMLQQQRQGGPHMALRRGPMGPPPGRGFPHRPHMGHLPGEIPHQLQRPSELDKPAGWLCAHEQKPVCWSPIGTQDIEHRCAHV